jgi:large subunit ribosomal protein L35
VVAKESVMPKMKTRRSAAKRFSLTGSGKFKRRRQNLRHILTKKNAKRKRRLGQSAIVDSANERSLRRQLPYA